MKIKALYLDVFAGKRLQDLEFDTGNFEELRRLLRCDCIDIVQRKVLDIRYRNVSIICDDEALLKDNKRVGFMAFQKSDEIFGNLIITGPPIGEELSSLTDKEIEALKGLQRCVQFNDNEVGHVLFTDFTAFLYDSLMKDLNK